jgi:hypothetical protein
VFKVLGDFITALETGATCRGAVSTALGGLDTSLDNVLTTRAQIGSQLVEVEQLGFIGSDLDLQYATTLSDLQDLDYNEAFSRLTQQRTYLEGRPAVLPQDDRAVAVQLPELTHAPRAPRPCPCSVLGCASEREGPGRARARRRGRGRSPAAGVVWMASELSYLEPEYLAGMLVAYGIYDPLAPTWSIEVSRSGEDRVRMDLHMKRSPPAARARRAGCSCATRASWWRRAASPASTS